MIVCGKCGGKVFVDLTFTDNRNFETFCLRCGNRNFVGVHHELFDVIRDYVRAALVG
jgi:ribosomal protein S27AE